MKDRALFILVLGLLLLSLGANIWLLRENRQLLAVKEVLADCPLKVHVSGAVANPGIYTLLKGDRVHDALAAAGGSLPGALLQGINLAKPLFDGEQINVAQLMPVAAASTEDAALNPFDSRLESPLININAASAIELEALPGIGPVKAKAIVDYRLQNGAFSRIDDLTKVPGIGPKTFDNLKHLIAV